MLSWDRARLSSGAAGARDSPPRQQGQGCGRDAGILEIPYRCFGFCGKVARPGKIRKEPPKGQSDKPISYYRRAQQATAAQSSSWELNGTLFNMERGTVCRVRTRMLGARLCTMNAKLILSPQAFFSILHGCFCQLHLIPIWLSKVSMGRQREVSPAI